jgi:hypothetical protein
MLCGENGRTCGQQKLGSSITAMHPPNIFEQTTYNREERKKLLRTARNHHILHMPMERMNNWCMTSLVV